MGSLSRAKAAANFELTFPLSEEVPGGVPLVVKIGQKCLLSTTKMASYLQYYERITAGSSQSCKISVWSIHDKIMLSHWTLPPHPHHRVGRLAPAPPLAGGALKCM